MTDFSISRAIFSRSFCFSFIDFSISRRICSSSFSLGCTAASISSWLASSSGRNSSISCPKACICSSTSPQFSPNTFEESAGGGRCITTVCSCFSRTTVTDIWLARTRRARRQSAKSCMVSLFSRTITSPAFRPAASAGLPFSTERTITPVPAGTLKKSANCGHKLSTIKPWREESAAKDGISTSGTKPGATTGPAHLGPPATKLCA